MEMVKSRKEAPPANCMKCDFSLWIHKNTLLLSQSQVWIGLALEALATNMTGGGGLIIVRNQSVSIKGSILVKIQSVSKTKYVSFV